MYGSFMPDLFFYRLFWEFFFNGSTAVCVFFLKQIIFLEFYTPRQKQKVKRAFLVCLLINLVLVFVSSFIIDQTLGIFFYSIIMAVNAFPIVYSSILSRKKAKWLGLFSIIPAYGYTFSIVDLINIPSYVGIITSDQNLYISGISAFLTAVLFVILTLKKPAFIRNIERDVEKRTLSFWEELGIWIVGIAVSCSLVFFAAIIEDLSPEIKIYISISSFFISFSIVLLILDSNYRKFYHSRSTILQKSLITTMADLVENRDENTGGHIQRTAKYVEIIAKKLKIENKFSDILTNKYINDMVIAAPLHDVGKIHIPDSVLNKPGKLDENEFSLMKTHTSAGGQIIERVEENAGDIDYLRIAKEMAEFHHERMDGKGYPHGISGNDIPLCARILAVADVFDALVSKRCYKDPMPFDKAFAIIEEESGSHFDPDVAKAFIDSRKDVEEFIKDNP